MISKKNNFIYTCVILLSLCTHNGYARTNDGFIAGACAIGASLLAGAGIAAFANWYYSETDDQMLSRAEGQYYAFAQEYSSTIHYFGEKAGVGSYAPYLPIHAISEAVLYECATFIWNKGISQYDYRSGVESAKHQLQKNIDELRRRIKSLQGKAYTYEDQRRMARMITVANNSETLLQDVALFAECLEHHKSYFNLYDSVGIINNRYRYEINLVESYADLNQLISYVYSLDSNRFPLRSYILSLESKIHELDSKINSLRYTYESGRKYALHIVRCLSQVQRTIMRDSRYQQELYEWEQHRLHEQKMRMLEEQARLERERINVLRKQNRILEEQNRLERQRLWQDRSYNSSDVQVYVDFVL